MYAETFYDKILESDLKSEPSDCPNEDEDDRDGYNVRDALIRKYSYKQAMCLGAFSNTVNQYSAAEIIF